MRKLLIALVAVCLAGSAAASSIDFAFGTNFYKPAAAGYTAENGQNFAVSWNLDSDVALGIYNEQSNVNDNGTMRVLTASAVQVAKGVLKSVKVGINLGSATCVTTATMVDIFGTVNILSGTGDKIAGSLVASASARFSQCDIGTSNEADGVNVGLAVLLGF